MQENCYGTSNSIAYGNYEAFLWQLRRFWPSGLPPPQGFSFTCTLNVKHHEDPDTRPDPSLLFTNTSLLHPRDHRCLMQGSSQHDQTCSGSRRETDELVIWQQQKPPRSHGDMDCSLPGSSVHGIFQYSCLENPLDRGAWWATVHRASKSWARLSE